MEKTRLESALQPQQEENNPETELRTLQDLELVLAGGGGDGSVTW